MATFILINTVNVGTVKLFPGQTIDDAQYTTTDIQNAGGLLWPTGNTDVDAAAALCVKMKAAGKSEAELESVMSAAVNKVQKANDAGGDVGIIQVVITQALIAAKGAVTSGTFDATTAFPTGARLLGVEGVVSTKVQNAGDTDTTTYAAGTDGAGKSAIGIAAATTADAGTAGGAIGVCRAVGGEKLRVTLTSDVNFSTLTAGAMTVTAMYVVPRAVL